MSTLAENNMTECKTQGIHLTLLNNLLPQELPLTGSSLDTLHKEDLLMAFEQSETLIYAF